MEPPLRCALQDLMDPTGRRLRGHWDGALGPQCCSHFQGMRDRPGTDGMLQPETKPQFLG